MFAELLEKACGFENVIFQVLRVYKLNKVEFSKFLLKNGGEAFFASNCRLVNWLGGERCALNLKVFSIF